MLKIIIFILFSFSAFSIEMNSEVNYSFPEGVNQKYKDEKLLYLGLQDVLSNYLKSKNLNAETFLTKLKEKNVNEDDQLLFLKSLFTKTQLLRLSFGNAKDETLAQSGTVVTEFDSQKIIDKYYELVLNLEEISQKNLYLTLNLELGANTKWEDLGVNSKTQFFPSLANAWKESYEKSFDQFQNIMITDLETQNKIESFYSKFNNETFEIKYFINYKNISENKLLNKRKFEIRAHLIVLKVQSRDSVFTYEFPALKKELSFSNKSDLSSTLATIGFNYLKSKLSEITEVLSTSKKLVDVEYMLTGKFLFSDISVAREKLSDYLKDLNIEVGLANISLTNTKLILKVPTAKQAEFLSYLSKMGKIALNENKNEQKFLIFDSNNNSFAIVTNN